MNKLRLRYCFVALLAFAGVFFISGCKKGEALPGYQFAKVYVQNKAFVNTPDISVTIDTVAFGVLEKGDSRTKLIARNSKPVTLTVKDPSTGEVLLDSVFTPSIDNQFRILIDNTLGLRQFYSATDQPDVDEGHWRIQLFHKVKRQGVEQTLTFKVFVDEDGSSTTFTELPIEFKNVKYGQLSDAIDITRITYDPPNDAYEKDIYIKGYDAATGELLIDIVPFNVSPINWLFQGTGRSYVMPVPVTEDTTTGALTFDWFSEIYPL